MMLRRSLLGPLFRRGGEFRVPHEQLVASGILSPVAISCTLSTSALSSTKAPGSSPLPFHPPPPRRLRLRISREKNVRTKIHFEFDHTRIVCPFEPEDSVNVGQATVLVFYSVPIVVRFERLMIQSTIVVARFCELRGKLIKFPPNI